MTRTVPAFGPVRDCRPCSLSTRHCMASLGVTQVVEATWHASSMPKTVWAACHGDGTATVILMRRNGHASMRRDREPLGQQLHLTPGGEVLDACLDVHAP